MFIYVAGKMRGIPEFNFSAFDETTAELRKMGHSVFSPAEWDRDHGFDPTGMTGNEPLDDPKFGLRQMLAKDCEYICLQADAICVLSGWEESRGARAEMTLAAALGLQAGLIENFRSGETVSAAQMVDSLDKMVVRP